MFPAAAPTACRATMRTPETIRRSATPYWKAENMRLLTVLDPAMKAPRAPVTPANIGHTCPTLLATHSAMAMGMEKKPAPFTSELMYTRTMGTVKTNTNPAPRRTRLDSDTARMSAGPLIRCKKKVMATTTIKTKPGRYNGVVTAEIPVAKMSFHATRTHRSQSPTGS